MIIELKAIRVLGVEHEVQLLNYLKATKYEVGIGKAIIRKEGKDLT